MIKVLLGIESITVLAASLFIYSQLGFSWILFFVLFLLPDLAMVGYLKNKRVGSYLYNAFHTYTIPVVVIGLGYLLSVPILVAVGLIWMAHIGMDRLVGYGLKYETDFKDTHLQRL